MIRKLLIFLLLTTSVNASAATRPRSAGYDQRVQNISYNANDATIIYSKLGFLTTLMFANDENVLDTRTGYEKGWDISFNKNTVFIMPRPVMQQSVDKYGETSMEIFPPTAEDWKTNLFVVTTKRHYVIELNSIDENEVPPAFLVNYVYPHEIVQQKEKLQEQAAIEQEQIKVAELLEEAAAPKNWDYFMQAGNGSDRIKPDFAYDNGVFTYLGFINTKLFPSAFSFIDGNEQLLNYSVQNKGKYKILVIHSVNDKFVLRYGDQVVGITNNSFGKVLVNNGSTISKKIERVDVKGGGK